MGTVYESYTSSDTGYLLYDDSGVSGFVYLEGQTFTSSSGFTITDFSFLLYRVGSGCGNITATLYAVDGSHKPTGAALATSSAVATSGLTASTSGQWVNFVFTSSYACVAATEYALVLTPSGGDSSNYVMCLGDASSPSYTGGARLYSSDGGSSWSWLTAADMAFKTYGSGGGTSGVPVDKRFSKQLVAIGNNELWYESSAGTMAELTAAADNIDTTAPLQMFELYEKVFIVNETKLRVVDFGNTKITTTDILPAGKTIPLHSDVLTGGTSGAKMVVDYIDATDGACNVYGKRITADTFSSGEVVTGTNANGDISFTTSAAETAPPHWYNWTVYANSTTYGTMPTQAVLGSPWRGRACLSGDEDYPHQYYQSRQENPWDWNYVSNDVQSPVAGGGDPSIPGQVGDIVIAQIPFDRDHLIYGGANSLWVLAGDAAEGGVLNNFYDEGGILGALAWAKDNNKNLYILSSVGLLKIPAGFGPPENLTQFIYPDFIKDLAYNSSLHRIVMGYDRVRNGIKIVKVTLASGANTGWWWDLKAQALFPESYGSTEHGIFSMFHYEAVNPNYNALLLGCNNGYICSENDSGTDDTLADDTAQAINSYITFGPIKLGEENREGKINSFIGITAGGGSGGSETDSNDVAFKIWAELSADKISEQFSANSGQKVSGTIKAPGRFRGNQFRRSIKGMFAGIRIGNSTAGEIWGLEKLLLGINKGGKLK